MTTTITDPALSTVRDWRAEHPQARIAEERRFALDHGCRLRFDRLPAPSYGDPVGSGETVVRDIDLRGEAGRPTRHECADCGQPIVRMALFSSGLIAVEHDGVSGAWRCAS